MNNTILFVILMQILGVLALIYSSLVELVYVDDIGKKLIYLIGISTLLLIPWIMIFGL